MVDLGINSRGAFIVKLSEQDSSPPSSTHN